jgi:hypothetical protein
VTPQTALETAYLTRTETMDGIPGVPWYVCQALGGAEPSSLRLARYGKVLACGPVAFPGYGTPVVTLFEGGALAFYPDAEGWERKAQKVHFRDLARVAEALGLT